MPSGAKKRKAAKRKKEEEEMGINHPPPHSSTNTPQGNNRLESESCDNHLTEEEVEMERSESGREEAKEEVMVVGERGEVVEETTTSDVDVYEVKEMGIEYVEAKMEDNGTGAHLEQESSSAEVSSEVVLQQLVQEASVAPLTEEEVEAATDLPEEEEKEEPPMSTVVGAVQIHDIERSEIAVTTEVAPAPLLEHRTSLWNCCGLLDVFKGNQR